MAKIKSQAHYLSEQAAILQRAAAILDYYQGSDAALAVSLLEDLAAQLDLGVLTPKE